MDKATRALLAVFLSFLALCLFAIGGASGVWASQPAAAPFDAATATLTATPVDLRTCQVGGRQADYGQTWQGVTITPYEQHDVGGHNLWQTTWRVLGPAGRTLEAEVVTYRCIGLTRTPEWDHCSAELAVETYTQTVSVTIPASGTTQFSTQSPVDCCEIDENDLMTVNGIPWGASFFVRWAESARCPFPGPSRTPSLTPTATATPTSTSTPTATPTPPFRKWPWPPELQPGYSQRYNLTLQTPTGSLMAGVVVTDVIPDGARFSDATMVMTGTTAPEDFTWYPSGGEWDGDRTVVWHVGDLPPGYYASMKVHVYAYSSVLPGAILTNIARMSSGGGPAITTSANTLIVADPATPTPKATATFTPTPQCPPDRIVLVDVGNANPYTDTLGAIWQPDRAYQAGGNTWGYVGQSAVYANGAPVWGTGDPALYQTERFWTDGGGGYRFVVADGDYLVLLKFAEIYPGVKVGTRVFTVRIEGVDVLAHLDVMDVAGANVAYDVLLPVHVGDGLLSVDFAAEQNLPAVKAIAVLAARPCTPTPTPSATASSTATASPTPTMTASATVTATETEIATATPTATETGVPLPTPSETPTATPAAPTETATPPATPTATMTYLPTKTASPTETETAAATHTATLTATASATAQPEATHTNTPTSPPTPTSTFHAVFLPIIIVEGE